MPFDLCDDGSKREEFHRALEPWKDAFHKKRYAELEQRFTGLFGAHAVGKATDAELKRAFAIFEDGWTWTEPLILDWIRLYPKSQAAYMALGYHYSARGFAALGPDTDARPSPAQSAAMRGELGYALRAFDVAEKLGGKPTPAIAQRIRIASADASFGLDPGALYRQAIATYPDTLEVRIQYIKASHPRRGGSLRQLESVIEGAKGMSEADQRYVRYLAYQEMGSALEAARDDKAAAAMYEKSIPLCPGLDNSINRAARLYKRLKKYDALVRLADEVIRRHPRSGWAFADRGLARRESQLFKESFADYERAMQLGQGEGYEGLAWFYEKGVVVPRDARRAIELYTLAGENGVESAKKSAEALRAKARS